MHPHPMCVFLEEEKKLRMLMEIGSGVIDIPSECRWIFISEHDAYLNLKFIPFLFDQKYLLFRAKPLFP